MSTWIYYTDQNFAYMHRSVAHDAAELAASIAKIRGRGDLLIRTSDEPLTSAEEDEALNAFFAECSKKRQEA